MGKISVVVAQASYTDSSPDVPIDESKKPMKLSERKEELGETFRIPNDSEIDKTPKAKPELKKEQTKRIAKRSRYEPEQPVAPSVQFRFPIAKSQPDQLVNLYKKTCKYVFKRCSFEHSG